MNNDFVIFLIHFLDSNSGDIEDYDAGDHVCHCAAGVLDPDCTPSAQVVEIDGCLPVTVEIGVGPVIAKSDSSAADELAGQAREVPETEDGPERDRHEEAAGATPGDRLTESARDAREPREALCSGRATGAR